MTTTKRLSSAMVQHCATTEVDINRDILRKAVMRAVAHGANFVSLPEVCNLMQRDRAQALAQLRPEADDPCLQDLCALAARHGVWVHIGSLALRDKGKKMGQSRLYDRRWRRDCRAL